MQEKIFVISTKNTHYVVGVDGDGNLQHLHWGKKARETDYSFGLNGEYNSNLDMIKQEYTVFGGTMYRPCSFKCEYIDKCRDTLMKFDSAQEGDGSLDITLKDNAYSLYVTLCYRYSNDSDVITRFVKIENKSQNEIKIHRLMSAEISLPGEEAYDVTNTIGGWGSELQLETQTLKNGTVSFESRKGITGHTNSPFVILSQNADEDNGEVYFACLGYGGNFKIEVNRDYMYKTRAYLGLSDFDFSYNLKAGEIFESPKAYIGYCNGFAQMSNMMNRFAVDNILPKDFAHKPLPVLYNSWEATEFDVNTEHQLKLARLAKSIGCELFVMDDGWFGQRKNDHAGLGDWYVNEEKFPNGIDELINGVNDLGMDFGLWFEPEMVNPDSDLYRAHPDWTYHYDSRTPSLVRNQLVLNITKPEVEQYIFDCLDSMLSNHNIRYIKWDMNRPFSEIGAENLENQQELWYLHTKAVYSIADRLKEKYPYLQLEACASGGGRADYGALSHFDMVWTSDNTDPVDRLDIQRGFSMVYPIKCMRAWVTDWNSSTRPVSLDFRFNSSMQGSLSIGSNLLNYSDEELEKSRKYIAFYKNIREVVQFGDLYRLKNYGENGFYANQYVSADRSKSVVFICTSANSMFNRQYKSIRLKGLDENADYRLKADNCEIVKSGAYFNSVPIDVNIWRALDSKIWLLEKV